MKIPNRWHNYKESSRIMGTRFVAFKVPLKKEYFTTVPSDKSLVPSKILQSFPKLKLVMDLTFTTKYYNGVEEFQKKGVQYVKLKCKGHVIPSNGTFEKFAKIVDEFIEKNPQDYLIGVHCTHGVNRTGYLIVRYMIERMGYTPDKALKEFLLSRGHAIERINYVVDLKLKKPSLNNFESSEVDRQRTAMEVNPTASPTFVGIKDDFVKSEVIYECTYYAKVT